MLPVRLFMLLNVRRKNEVTADDLQTCVHRLCSSLDAEQHRIDQLQVDNRRFERLGTDDAQATLMRNEMEMKKIEKQQAENQEALR